MGVNVTKWLSDRSVQCVRFLLIQCELGEPPDPEQDKWEAFHHTVHSFFLSYKWEQIVVTEIYDHTVCVQIMVNKRAMLLILT